MSSNAPQNPAPLGLKRTFGFGDRLGLATAGHLAAVQGSGFTPVFAQQSMRELSRTGRSAAEVLAAARAGLAAGPEPEVWGADIDAVKTPEEAQAAAEAGFRTFSIDSTAFVVPEADRLDEDELRARMNAYIGEGTFPKGGPERLYEDARHEVSATLTLRLTREVLLRAAVKYGRALAHAEAQCRAIDKLFAKREEYEVEVGFSEAETVTSPLEHLFLALEFKRRKMQLVGFAPRYLGDLEKGIDFRGDLEAFGSVLEQHVAIARSLGPYKLVIHGGSDKFSLYPLLGAVCGENLHIKTSGTSYLEALRVVARKDPGLMAEVLSAAADNFAGERQGYRVSTTVEEVRALRETAPEQYESVLLDGRAGRQMLHVTYGAVLDPDNGGRLGDRIRTIISTHQDLYCELLETHFRRHFKALAQGSSPASMTDA